LQSRTDLLRARHIQRRREQKKVAADAANDRSTGISGRERKELPRSLIDRTAADDHLPSRVVALDLAPVPVFSSERQ
jgi:hypothetical protein